MPLPPSSSRPQATVSRDFAVQNAFASAGVMVAKLALIGHLRQADHHALACSDVGEHLGEQILHHLEGGDRLAELQSFLART